MKSTSSTVLIAVASFLSIAPLVAQSAIPSQMTYQAVITDENNDLIAPGTAEVYKIIIRIHTTKTGGAESLWSEEHVTSVLDGRFSVLLGNGSPVAIPGGTEKHGDLNEVFSGPDAESDLFIEIEIGKNEDDAIRKKLAPRQKIVATATAFRAMVAEGLVEGGLKPSAIADGSLTDRIFANGVINSLKINGVTSNIQTQLDGKATQVSLNSANAKIINLTSFKADKAELSLKADNSDLLLKADKSSPSLTGKVSIDNGELLFEEQSFAAPQLNAAQNGGNGMRVVLWPGRTDRTDENGMPYGLGVEGGAIWSTTRPGAAHKWYEGTTERMRLTAGGNLSIGFTSSSRAKLAVFGSESYDPGDYRIFDRTLADSTGDTSQSYSIYASHRISASSFDAYSDARIKSVNGISDAASDLDILDKVEITDYTHRDVVGKGNRPHKKVIAQQVEEIFPQAVSKITDVIPDIYQNAEMDGDWIQIATNLKKGEKVRLIGASEEEIYEVLEVGSGKFRTDLDETPDGSIFVFGREVDDFRTVDYEAIAMLNVSATQELHRRLIASEKEVESLKARMIALEKLVSNVAVPVKTASK